MAGKMKSHKWVAKRFKITKWKKVICSKSCNNHLLTNKWKNNKKFVFWKEVVSFQSKKVKNLIPYNS